MTKKMLFFCLQKIDALIINNAEWYKDMNCVDFLAEVCRPFRVGTMLKRSSIRERMSSVDGLAFSEFAYQTMQVRQD
jgi:tyrosyl-tRNA synthetase